MFTGEEATAQVVATELQGMHQRVVSESGRLDEEVQRTRQEVAREAQVPGSGSGDPVEDVPYTKRW
jgi:hypothetical protein